MDLHDLCFLLLPFDWGKKKKKVDSYKLSGPRRVEWRLMSMLLSVAVAMLRFTIDIRLCAGDTFQGFFHSGVVHPV